MSLDSTILADVKHQNPSRVVSVNNAFIGSDKVEQYLAAQIRSILPNASKYPDTNVLLAAWLKYNIDKNKTAYSVKQTEVDFGALPVANATFTVIDRDITPNSNIVATVAYEAPTGKDLDEVTMDNLQIRAGQATNGSFQMYIETADGSYLADNFKINYTIS